MISKKDNVKFFSRVHNKDVKAVVEFMGESAGVVVYKKVRYSVQLSQLTKL